MEPETVSDADKEAYEALFAENRARYLARLDEHRHSLSVPQFWDVPTWNEAVTTVPVALHRHIVEVIASSLTRTHRIEPSLAASLAESVLAVPAISINVDAVDLTAMNLPVYGPGVGDEGPVDGDIVEVARYVFKHGTLHQATSAIGYWHTDPDVALSRPDRGWGSGKAYLDIPYLGRHRVRTEGPADFDTHIEYDYVALIEARHGAPAPTTRTDEPSVLSDWNSANEAAIKRAANYHRSARREARKRAITRKKD